MLDDLKKERQAGFGNRERMRLAIYAGLLVAIAGFIVFGKSCGGKGGPEDLPLASDDPATIAANAPKYVDKAKLASAVGDQPVDHARWSDKAIAELADDVKGALADVPRRLTADELAALPFAAAQGGVFEVTGKVTDLTSEVHGTGAGRLWAVVVTGPEGGTVLALKQGLSSDTKEGAPFDSNRASTIEIVPGDSVIARGILMQRRTGTVGNTALPDPAPVLMAMAFRKTTGRTAAPIADLTEADWVGVKDRFMAETRRYNDPAFYEVMQWLRLQGHERLLADIRSGAIPTTEWDQDTFTQWSAEVDVRSSDAPRPFIDKNRGKVFTASGIFGAMQKEGWDTIAANEWGVDEIYVYDVASDDYGNKALRVLSPFPPDLFGGVEGERFKHVRVTGIFFKNFTYDTKQGGEGRNIYQPLTMPLFLVIHIETLPPSRAGRELQTLMWIVSGGILVFAFVFYFVLIRGERKEAKKMDERRLALRHRARRAEVAKRSGEGAGGEGDAGPPRA